MKFILFVLSLLVTAQVMAQPRVVGPRYNPPGGRYHPTTYRTYPSTYSTPVVVYNQPGYSLCSQYRVGDYVYVNHGAMKTAQIVDIRGCVATIQYYGQWVGTYTQDLNDPVVSLQTDTYSGHTSRCMSYYPGEYIYVNHGTYKTAQILDIRGCSATIQYYGNWSGTYTIDLNDPVVSHQR